MMEMVLEICMAAAVVLVTRYLVPWLRGRLEAEGRRPSLRRSSSMSRRPNS